MKGDKAFSAGNPIAPDRLDGPLINTFASRVEGPGSNSGTSQTSDLKAQLHK